jgi:hypothetical protein
MQNTISKEHRAIDKQVEADIQRFLSAGGVIQEIPRGVSSKDTSKGLRFCIGCNMMRPPGEFPKTRKKGCSFTCKKCIKAKTKPRR